MSAGLAFIIVWALLWVLLLSICLWAIRAGGAAERAGALLILAAAAFSAAGDLLAYVNGLRTEPSFLIGRLAAEGFLALGFLVLSVRYGSLWLGGVMLLQSFQFTLQATYFVTQRPHDAIYSTVNNVNFLGILTCLALATAAEQRRRRVAPQAHEPAIQAAA
jgi:hypothetical protein